MRLVLIVSVLLGLLLLGMLATATGNTTLFARHYTLLVILNVGMALALLGLVGYQALRLVRSLRKRKFGSRLTLRFMILFCLMALLPGALVYTVSVQFLTKSIESWFDVRVDNALEGGLNLGRAMLDNLVDDLSTKGRTAALDLAEMSAQQQASVLNRVREQVGADEALLLGGQGVLAVASRQLGSLAPDVPTTALLRQARQNRGYRGVESVGDRGLKLRVLVPIAAPSVAEEPRYLQLTQAVPPTLAGSAEAVQSVHRAYRELQLSRKGLREIYIFALTLTLLLTLFTAFALAFILSRRLAEPLATLAEATEAVARGDFSRRAKVTSADELGTLTASFNSMTQQLDEARTNAERNRLQVENARAHLENVLANLSTGVLVLDQDMRLAIANAGASRILGEPLDSLRGQTLGGVPTLAAIDAAIRTEAAAASASPWQRQLELDDRGQVLVLRGTRLPAAAGSSYVVVFDDVTALIQAQRATAWAEVAQRLAHEIKNPLTPIQLAAERMQLKLHDKLTGDDAVALKRSTDTIISHVGAMKAMVDEFRDYSRLPAPKLAPVDLNSVIAEVITLYEPARHIIQLKLGADLPRVAADASQLRQVIHNLLQNAQDAVGGRERARIEVSTSQVEHGLRLTISDTGGGLPDGLIKRAFEPYVTTKPKGTGLGLAIVKKIIDEHHGRISLNNWSDAQDGIGGARVVITLPLADRTDSADRAVGVTT